MTENLRLDPNLYLEAARYLDSGESHGVYYALYRAAFRQNVFYLNDLSRHIEAWKKEFETVPCQFMALNDLNMDLEEKINSLKRMAYLAEKEDV